MPVDKVVEIFQATMILAVMGVVTLYIWAPNLGETAIDILPGFLKVVIYFFLILIVVTAVAQEFQ